MNQETVYSFQGLIAIISPEVVCNLHKWQKTDENKKIPPGGERICDLLSFAGIAQGVHLRGVQR
jgi:hypothetical protein